MPVPGAAGDVDMPSCLGAALACFEEDGFVKDCKAALNAKIKSSRSDPEKQRDEAVVIIKGMRKCMKNIISKKEALSKATIQYEGEVAQIIAGYKLQSEADATRAEAAIAEKSLATPMQNANGGPTIHFKERMRRLEQLESQLQRNEKDLEDERVAVRKEERERAVAEAEAKVNHSMAEIQRKQAQLKKAEAELKDRRLQWHAMEQEFKIVAEEGEREKQLRSQIEDQNRFLQNKCTSLENDLVRIQEELNEAREEEFSAQQTLSSIQETLENERVASLEQQRTSDEKHANDIVSMKEELETAKEACLDSAKRSFEEQMQMRDAQHEEELASELDRLADDLGRKHGDAISTTEQAHAQALQEQKHDLCRDFDDQIATLKHEMESTFKSDKQTAIDEIKGALLKEYTEQRQALEEGFQIEKKSLMDVMESEELALKSQAARDLEAALDDQKASMLKRFGDDMQQALEEQKACLTDAASSDMSASLTEQ